MDEKNENIEGSFEELEDTAESYQEQKENLDKREESLSQAISILEQDTLIQKVIEVNVENLTAEQAEIENEL